MEHYLSPEDKKMLVKEAIFKLEVERFKCEMAIVCAQNQEAADTLEQQVEAITVQIGLLYDKYKPEEEE